MIGGSFGSVPFASIPGGDGGVTPTFVLRIGPDDTAARYLQIFSWSISKELNARDTFSCDLLILDPGDTWRPKIGQEVVLTVNGVRIFAGTINDKEEAFLTEAEAFRRKIHLECTDWNQILDRRTLVKSYEQTTYAGDIVRDIIDSYLAAEGITAGTIQDGLQLPANWNHEAISHALDELSKDVGFYWFVDYEKRLHFLPRTAATAPFAIDEVNSHVANFRIKESRNDYRNTQIIKGWKEITNAQTERFVGDGENRTYTLAYPLYDEPVIRRDGQPQTVGVRGIETGKQWYWSKDQNEINQNQGDGADEPLSASEVLEVVYIGSYAGITYQQDAAAVAERSAVEGGTGIYEAVDVDASLEGGDVVIARGNGMLRRYGVLDAEGEFDVYQDGLDIGQLLQVDYPTLGLPTADMLITRIELSQITPEVRQYRVSCTTGEVKNTFKEFWMKFALTGQKVGVREGEIVEYPVVLVDALGLADTLTVNAVSAHTAVVDVDFVEFAEVG